MLTKGWRRVLPSMSRAEIDEFLQRPLVAVLTTVRPDGALHSTPVWFEYEAGIFYFWIGSNSVKAGNIRGNSEASACIATHGALPVRQRLWFLCDSRGRYC